LPPALAERFADYGLPVTVGEEEIQDEKETAVGH